MKSESLLKVATVLLKIAPNSCQITLCSVIMPTALFLNHCGERAEETWVEDILICKRKKKKTSLSYLPEPPSHVLKAGTCLLVTFRDFFFGPIKK